MLTPHGDRFHFPGIYYLVEWRWGLTPFIKRGIIYIIT